MTRLYSQGDPDWLVATDIHFGHLEHGREIEDVIRAFEGVGYVAGGAARYLLVPEAPEPKDIDVFLFGRHMDLSPMEELGYEPQGGSPRAPGFVRANDELSVQVVIPADDQIGMSNWGSPLRVLSQFTFKTEQAAVWYGAGGFAGLLSVMGKEDTENRVLNTNNHRTSPILSLYRINKYGQKGYTISMETLLEITTVLHRLSNKEYEDAILYATQTES